MSEVTKRQKAAAEDYTQACKAYAEAKKDNPNEPKPKQAAIVVLEKMVKGKDKAEALVAKYRDKYEERQNKKQETDDTAKPTEEKVKKET